MLELWRAWKGGGFGPGHLPDAGGTLDQPAAMIEAFRIMSAADAAMDQSR